jgi:threonine/homoserine/homoserine lactone efflux protein
MTIGLARRASRPAAAALVTIGAVVLAFALARDVPKTNEDGLLGQNYADGRATAGSGCTPRSPAARCWCSPAWSGWCAPSPHGARARTDPPCRPETVGLFALAALALVAIPGPNLVYIANRALADGRRAGLASVLASRPAPWSGSARAAAGLSALLASSAVAFDAVRYAGAAYLVYLGVRTLRARDDDAVAEPAAASLGRAYREALLVQLSNPKVAVFFLALLPHSWSRTAGRPPPRSWCWGSCSRAWA